MGEPIREDDLASHTLDRRTFIAALAAGAGALALSRTTGRAEAAATTANLQQRPNHLAWVWRFDADGQPDAVRDVLAANGLGIILKTHDGDGWMARYRQTLPVPINGGADVGTIAAYFEAAGVPFHAWCVVDGRNPIVEAHMAAEVLDAGARTLTFDLEPAENGNYWQGTAAAALAFGAELRRLHPDAWLTVAPDPRPWQVKAVPMAEFASFCNEIQPQTYWNTFNSPTNIRMLRERGFPPGPDGVTPELILDVTHATLAPFGRPIRPVGQGAADRPGWERFFARARSLGMDSVSVWRYGTARPEVMSLLGELRPVIEPPKVETSPAVFVPPAQPAVEPPPVVEQETKPPAQPPPAQTEPPEPPIDSRKDEDAGRETKHPPSSRSNVTTRSKSDKPAVKTDWLPQRPEGSSHLRAARDAEPRWRWLDEVTR